MRQPIIALLIVLLCVPDLPARSAADWGHVKKLKPGTSLYVLLWSGENLSGQLDAVNDASLRLDTADSSAAQTSWQRDLPRKSIRRIVRPRNQTNYPNQQHWMLIGAAGGGAIGVTAGAIGDAKHGNNGRWIVDGFAGAVFGFLASVAALFVVDVAKVGQSTTHAKVVYEADSNPPPPNM